MRFSKKNKIPARSKHILTIFLLTKSVAISIQKKGDGAPMVTRDDIKEVKRGVAIMYVVTLLLLTFK